MSKRARRGGGVTKAPRHGGGGRGSKTTERERETRERLVRMAREGERHCEGGRQCTVREEEEAATKGKKQRAREEGRLSVS